MYKHTKAIARNVGIGIAAGTALVAVGSKVISNRQGKHGHNMKRGAEKAMHNVGSVIEGVGKMLQ